MPYLYLVNTAAELTDTVSSNVCVHHVTKHTFSTTSMVIIVVEFSTLKCTDALANIANSYFRTVCTSTPIVPGVTVDGRLVWSTHLEGNTNVLFSATTEKPSVDKSSTVHVGCKVVHHYQPLEAQVISEEIVASGTVDHASASSVLRVGDDIAYLLPDVPVEDQHVLIITQVQHLQPLRVSNGHTLDASLPIGRYVNGRVQFPLRRVRDFLHTI